MRSAIALYTIDLEVEETVKFKNTINESGFITYSNTIYFYGIWLDNSVYLITQWKKNAK